MRLIITLLLCLLLPTASFADKYVAPGEFVSTQTIVSFWANDCEPCQQQVPLLYNFARFNPGIKVVVVTLGGHEGDYKLPTARPSNLLTINVTEPATSLRAFGSGMEPLPFHAYVRPDGSICRSRAGVQGVNTFEDWVKQCK